MRRNCRLPTGALVFATTIGLLPCRTLVPILVPLANAATPEHHSMLIDRMSLHMWDNQSRAKADQYPGQQLAFSQDVATYLAGRFKVVGTIMFLLKPSEGIILDGEPFQTSVSSAFQEVGCTPAIGDRAYIRPVPDHANAHAAGKAQLGIGVTYPNGGTYTAIGLYAIAGTGDQLMGYFQLEPLVADPVKNL